ncbi:MAG: FG-GAP-like repeat-containing protein [Flavobacteriales bacterium]
MRPLRLTSLLLFVLLLPHSRLRAQFGPEQSMTMDGPVTVDVVDMDLDGDRDLLIGSRLGILLYENSDGLGTFGTPIPLGTGIESRAHVVDMDGNGWPDILASRELDGGIVWFRNLGAFGWSMAFDVVPGATAMDLGSSDLDADGDSDPFFVLSNGTLAWCENTDGNGATSAAMSVASIYNTAHVQAVDLDADSDMDLVWSVPVPEEMGWCENTGSSFGYAQSISPDRNGHLSDLDGDGNVDLVSTSVLAGSLDWQRGSNAQLAFGPFSNVAFGTNADAMLVQDLDGDGDRDVALSNDVSDEISWYENVNGQGAFGPAQIISYDVDDAMVLAAGDVDGDGDPEFFALTSTQNRMVWFRNLSIAQLMITGRVYNDIDADGAFNGTDHGLFNVRVDLSDGRSTFTNHSGMYWFDAAPGNYSVEVEVPSMWQLTNTGVASAMVAAPNGSALDRDFGLHAGQPFEALNAQLGSGAIRCTEQIPYYLNVTNTGNQIRDLRLTLNVDNISGFVIADPEPSTVNGNTITWDFTAVQPSHARSVTVKVQMADGSHMGVVMNDLLSAESLDNGLVVHTAIAEYHPTLVCALDPNDKQVVPVGEAEEHFTPMNANLEYTVRFMNTGNAPALDVVILDQLDSNLDPSTLQVLASSHTVHVLVDADGMIRFEHMGINLPDSGSNYEQSQGFVRFRIRALNGLSEGTVVNNTADIYFDNNPAITTNTVFNTLTYGLVDGVAEVVAGDEVLRIVPNPVQDQAIITVDATFDGAADLHLTDAAGRLVRRWKVRSNEQVHVNMAGTTAGIYNLQLALPGEQAHVTRMVIE